MIREGLCNHNDSQMCHFFKKGKKKKNTFDQRTATTENPAIFFRTEKSNISSALASFIIIIIFFFSIYKILELLYGSIPIYHTLCSRLPFSFIVTLLGFIDDERKRKCINFCLIFFPCVLVFLCPGLMFGFRRSGLDGMG